MYTIKGLKCGVGLLDVTLSVTAVVCGFEQEDVRVETSARCYLYSTHDSSNVLGLYPTCGSVSGRGCLPFGL